MQEVDAGSVAKRARRGGPTRSLEVGVRRRGLVRCATLAAALVMLATACGVSDQGDQVAATSPAVPHSLTVTPGNSSLLVGVDRISVALFDERQRPVTGARATIEI